MPKLKTSFIKKLKAMSKSKPKRSLKSRRDAAKKANHTGFC